jgi:hypothetical protein
MHEPARAFDVRRQNGDELSLNCGFSFRNVAQLPSDLRSSFYPAVGGNFGFREVFYIHLMDQWHIRMGFGNGNRRSRRNL